MTVPWRRKVSFFFHVPYLVTRPAPVPLRTQGRRNGIRVPRRWRLESDVQSLDNYFLRRNNFHSGIRSAYNSPFPRIVSKMQSATGSLSRWRYLAPLLRGMTIFNFYKRSTCVICQGHHDIPGTDFRIWGARPFLGFPRIYNRRRDVFEVLYVARGERGVRCQHNARDHGVACVNRTASPTTVSA